MLQPLHLPVNILLGGAAPGMNSPTLQPASARRAWETFCGPSSWPWRLSCAPSSCHPSRPGSTCSPNLLRRASGVRWAARVYQSHAYILRDIDIARWLLQTLQQKHLAADGTAAALGLAFFCAPSILVQQAQLLQRRAWFDETCFLDASICPAQPVQRPGDFAEAARRLFKPLP